MACFMMPLSPNKHKFNASFFYIYYTFCARCRNLFLSGDKNTYQIKTYSIQLSRGFDTHHTLHCLCFHEFRQKPGAKQAVVVCYGSYAFNGGA